MLKTLLLTHEYYPFPGGVARYCYNLFRHFDTNKYLVVSDHPVVVSQNNIIHLQLKNKFIRPSWFFSFFKLGQIIKREGIEQIFTPNILPLGSMAYLFFKIFKIPYVISLHGLDINNALNSKPKLTLVILKSAKHIICNTKYTALRLQSLDLPKNKISIIYPSLSAWAKSEPSVADLRAKYNIQADDKVLLTVARLNYRKGHDLVIKALAHLNKFKIKYLVVGSGNELANLKQLVKQEKIEDRVIFCGTVSDQALPSFYQLADIFIMPHREIGNDVEGFGMVFLEAASQALPIIAGNSGGVTEIFTDNLNILLIKNDDEEELGSILTKVLNNDKLLLDLGQQALQVALNFPSASKQSQSLAKILS